MATIGDLCSPKQWKALSKSKMVSSGYPAYGANGVIGYTSEYTHEEPTILVGCRGTIGAIHISAPKAFVTGNAMALDQLATECVSIHYLARYLTWRGLADVTSGSSQPQLTRQNLIKVEVPLPPLPEQRRIATILDHADTLTAKRRQILTQLNSLIQSTFYELCASGAQETRSLGDVAELRAGVGFPPRLQGRTAGDYPMAKVGDIGRVGRSVEESMRSTDHWVDEADLAVLKTRPVPAGSVLFAKIGEAIRHNHRVIAARPLLLDNNAMAAIPGDAVSSSYLFAYLNTVDFYSLASSTTVPSLRKSDLAALPVPLPSKSEQMDFEARFDEISRTRSKFLQAAVAEGQLFESLQFRAFRGEL